MNAQWRIQQADLHMSPFFPREYTWYSTVFPIIETGAIVPHGASSSNVHAVRYAKGGLDDPHGQRTAGSFPEPHVQVQHGGQSQGIGRQLIRWFSGAV